MFDFGETADRAERIFIECRSLASDDDSPVQVVFVDEDGDEFHRIKLTPKEAEETAWAVTEIMSNMSPRSAFAIASGLRQAATRVRAARN